MMWDLCGSLLEFRSDRRDGEMSVCYGEGSGVISDLQTAPALQAQALDFLLMCLPTASSLQRSASA